MGCHTPGCEGERERGILRHSVIYRQRTIVLEGVPASVCPDCGDASLSEETTIAIADLLQRKARSKKTVFAYEA